MMSGDFEFEKPCDKAHNMGVPSESPKNILQWLFALFTDPRYFWVLAFLVIIGDTVLTELILRVVSCEPSCLMIRAGLEFVHRH